MDLHWDGLSWTIPAARLAELVRNQAMFWVESILVPLGQPFVSRRQCRPGFFAGPKAPAGGADDRETAPAHLSIAAALAAALWATHPMRVETTAWTVELVFVQPLFLFLLALLCYLRSADAGSGRSGPFYWASVALFTASLVSFPIALGGCVVFIAFDIYPLRRLSVDPWRWLTPAARRVWLEKLPFVATALFFGWFNLHVRAHPSTAWSHLTTLEVFSPAARVMQAFYMWAYYVWRPWWPVHLTPVPTQLMDFKPFDAPFVLSAILVLGLGGWLFCQRRRWPGLFVIWFCHL